MPLRCLEPESGKSVYAFDLLPEAWEALRVENGRRRHLRLPCCAAEVSLRRSKLGTAHFLHKARGPCTTAPETEAHLHLKRLAVEAARAAGWEAETEAVGETPEGEPWRADVLAWRGDERVAIEVQWSPQTDEETLRRQARYRASGVLGVWLFRQASFPVVEGLPAARIRGAPEEGFTALVLTSGDHDQASGLPVSEFLRAALDGRLGFGLPLGQEVRVTIHGAKLFCQTCGAQTEIITGGFVEAGPYGAHLRYSRLDRHGLLGEVQRELPPTFPAAAIRVRRGGTQGGSGLGNGCSHCDAPISGIDALEARDDPRVLCSFRAVVDERWRGLLREHGGPDAWNVFEAPAR